MSGLAFRAAEYVYSAPRRLKNRLLNMLDLPVLVLLYHRVNSLSEDPYCLAVTPENFRSQLLFLKRNFDIVRFEEDWSGLKRPAVAITFDDGYADNLIYALPLLEEMEIPATFFVSTGFVGTAEEFWWDELGRIVLGDRPFPETFELNDSLLKKVWSTGSASERRMLFGDLHGLMLKIDAERRDNWLGQLRQWAAAKGDGNEVNRAMTIEEIQSLANSKWVTVGAHTVSHTPLSALPVAEQQREIHESKRQLESWLGSEISVFSYPFGRRSDYTADTVKLCREAGFARAAANFPAQVHRWTDRYQIPRHTVLNWSEERFSKEVKRFMTI
jgi:peptidoglycan/xylan/chitin deacetylase (PgdA/CDA1 family)